MKQEHWHALLATYRHARELLERTLPAPVSGAARSSVRVGTEAIRHLERLLLDEVNALRKALADDFSAEQVEELLHPFVFLLDEQVLRRLYEAEQVLWPLLQQRLFGVDSGGDIFFDSADEQLKHSDTSPILFEVFYFCLLAGFEGRHADNAAKLQGYKARLVERIPRPQPVEAPPPPLALEMLPIYEFPMRYYLVSGSLIVALPVLLWWISNN